jgi:hypothetical protein
VFWWKSLSERDHLEDQGVDGRMGSEWIFGRLARGVEWIQLAQGPVAGCCECSDESSGSGATELVGTYNYQWALKGQVVFIISLFNKLCKFRGHRPVIQIL